MGSHLVKEEWTLEDSYHKALSEVGKNVSYNLFTWNCQYWAWECRTGYSFSPRELEVSRMRKFRGFNANYLSVIAGWLGGGNLADYTGAAFGGETIVWELDD